LSSDGETCKGINNYYFSLTTTWTTFISLICVY
jgi:hypothetical protein